MNLQPLLSMFKLIMVCNQDIISNSISEHYLYIWSIKKSKSNILLPLKFPFNFNYTIKPLISILYRPNNVTNFDKSLLKVCPIRIHQFGTVNVSQE